MVTLVFPYNRDISASMHVNANEREYARIKKTKKLLFNYSFICFLKSEINFIPRLFALFLFIRVFFYFHVSAAQT